MLAGCKQGELPHSSVHGSRHGKTQRAHPTPAHTARRPPGEHLSPRGRIPKGPGAVRRVSESTHFDY